MSSNAELRTESERLFATYLDEANYSWEYEPAIPGHAKKPDFRIVVRDIGLLCDVKQRSATAFTPGFRDVEPIEGIRKLIEKGRKKFETFNDHTCILVVYNAGDHNTWLEPDCIFEAMLGDGGISMRFSPNSGTADIDSAQSVFLQRGGKMIKRYPTMEPHISTNNISAIAALKRYRMPNLPYEMAYNETIDRRSHELGRPLTLDERCVIRCELILSGIPAAMGTTIGLTICDNPFASHPLPDSAFTGAFDERWSLVEGEMARVFSGSGRMGLGR